ncbi:hypothetical protein Tco_0040631 [Tanacetum coccineum]
MELELEQTQQGSSHEVSNIRVIPKYHSEDGNPARANIKQALGRYEHVSPQDTRSQDGERPQVDNQRLDLADDLKEAQDHISRTITSHKTKITTSKVVRNCANGNLKKFCPTEEEMELLKAYNAVVEMEFHNDSHLLQQPSEDGIQDQEGQADPTLMIEIEDDNIQPVVAIQVDQIHSRRFITQSSR